MDNMGGLTRLYFVDAEYYGSMTRVSDYLYNLLLGSGYELEEIVFIEDSGSISQSETETENGTLYNIKVTCKVARVEPGNADPLKGIRSKKLMLIAYDSDGNIWLAGAPGTYFNVDMGSSTGTNSADLKHRILELTASLSTSMVFIGSIA